MTCLLREGFHILIKSVLFSFQSMWDITIHPLWCPRSYWHTTSCLPPFEEGRESWHIVPCLALITSDRGRFPHPYKECFVLFPNQCGTSQRHLEKETRIWWRKRGHEGVRIKLKKPSPSVLNDTRKEKNDAYILHSKCFPPTIFSFGHSSSSVRRVIWLKYCIHKLVSRPILRESFVTLWVHCWDWKMQPYTTCFMIDGTYFSWPLLNSKYFKLAKR